MKTERDTENSFEDHHQTVVLYAAYAVPAGLAISDNYRQNKRKRQSLGFKEAYTMSKKIVQTAGRDQLGEFAPDFAHFNDDILFGENWNNEDIDLKTRSIITVVALMSQGITDSSIKYHIMNAKKNGVSQKEMAAVITHTAFYAGWPKAWAVFNLAKEVYNED